MKRIIAVAMFLLTLVTAPSGFAQTHFLPPITLIVVGNDTPHNYLSGDQLAQQFSLSSPTYISRFDLALYSQFGAPSGGCNYTVEITQSLGPGSGIAPPLLQRTESLPAASGPFLLSESFPAILLPAGTYFLVLDAENCAGGMFVFWSQVAQGSSEVGIVGLTFQLTFQTNSIQWVLFPSLSNQSPFAFDLAGPPLVPPTGGGLGQIARLVVEGPVTPAPGGPVEAQIGFLDPVTGTPVAPLSIVTLNAGQAQSVDVPLSPLVTRIGQHVDLLPVIAQPPGAVQANPIQLSATVQILDAVTGFGTVLSHALQPGASVPTLGPQILAGGQTLRVTVVAGTDPCIGNVGFNDLNGNPLVQSTPLNLMPGTGTSVDLDADTLSLKLGQRIEAQPALTVTQPAAAVALNSVCQASAEVFDHVTGRTWSYQSTMAALPAVQSAAAAPQ
jgi:hypothetical protein